MSTGLGPLTMSKCEMQLLPPVGRHFDWELFSNFGWDDEVLEHRTPVSSAMVVC